MTTYEQIPLLHECTCGAQVNFPLAADGRRLCACNEELDDEMELDAILEAEEEDEDFDPAAVFGTTFNITDDDELD